MVMNGIGKVQEGQNGQAVSITDEHCEMGHI